MATIAALFLLFGQTPDLSMKIDYQTAGETISQFSARLTSLTKMRFEASPLLAGDVVAISAKGVAVKDLMDRIAKADSAEWKADGDTYRLVADTAARNREVQEEATARAAAFRQAIAKRVADSAERTNPKSPVTDDTVITRLLSTIAVADIASMRPGQRMVFSTNPTRMQKRLGAVGPLINQWITSHNESIADSQAGMQSATQMMGGKMPAFLREMMEMRLRKVTEPISKVNLVLAPMPIFDGLRIDVKAFTNDGKVALMGNSMMSPNMSALIDQAMGKTAKESTTETPVKWSSDTQALTTLFGSMRSGMGSTLSLKLPPELKTKLMNPDRFEPLSFGPGDLVLNLGEAKKKPIVAVLPDEMMVQPVLGTSLPKTIESFEKSLVDGERMRSIPDQEWLVLRPSKPNTARQFRLNRLALRQLVKTVVETGSADLDTLSAFAVAGQSPNNNAVSMFYSMLFVPNALQQGFSGMTDWDMLKFYGMLTLGQRQTLAAGGNVPFSAFTPAQVKTLNNMVFGPNAQLDIEGSPADDDIISRSVRSFVGSGGDFRTEATEVLGNGLTMDGYLQMSGTRDNFIRLTGANDGESYASLGADEMAMINLLKASPMASQLEGALKMPDKGRLGERTVMRFTFRLTQEVSIHQTLQDDRLAKDAQTVSLSSLPANFQKSVDGRLEALKKSGFGELLSLGALGGRGSGINP